MLTRRRFLKWFGVGVAATQVPLGLAPKTGLAALEGAAVAPASTASSNSVTAAYVRQFTEGVHVLAQQKASRLRAIGEDLPKVDQ